MEIKIQEVGEKQEWEGFLGGHPEANFLQSWNWGEFYQRLGQRVWRRGFYRGEELQGVMLVVEERAKRARYLTVAGGPIFEWFDQELIEAAGQELKDLGKREKAAFVRVRPQLADDEAARKIFQEQWGMVRAPMHLSAELTHRLDLTKSEAKLLAGMRKSTRYEIRQAEKQGLRLEETTDERAIESFHQLQLETAKRQSFVPFSLTFWREQFAAFAADKQVKLYSSFFEDQLLAQGMIIFYGQEAVYHYGASTDSGRRYPGAYQIQWAAIREAQARGMTRYNFWGVAPVDQPEHRFAKLSVFKRGFGGEDWAYLPAQDLVIDKLKYKINLVIEKSRKKLRRV